MIYNENNWYKWFYDDGESFASRTSINQVLNVSYGHCEKVKTFKDALLDNARSTIDHFPGEKLELLMSGGIDSELVLRVYKELKYPITCHIFRYENDYNIYDVSFAIAVCESLSVPYILHDFNLQHFIENDAFEYARIAGTDRVRAVVQLAFLKEIDNVVISASSDPSWYRPNDDYTKKAVWLMCDYEHDIAMDRFAAVTGKTAIMQWFKWSPALTLGWFSLRWFNDLLSDRIPGKLGMVSTKIQGYKEVYPDIQWRLKKTGFENASFIEPIQQEIIRLNGGINHHDRQNTVRTADQLWEEMTHSSSHKTLHF